MAMTASATARSVVAVLCFLVLAEAKVKDTVCEDDDEGFVYNASLQNLTVTSCAEDAAGLCVFPEVATLCCATCAEALTVCADHDDTLALINSDLSECSLAFLYGWCENEDTSFIQQMCCESCSSSNATCEDHDDIAATWFAEGVGTCSDVAVYGWCDDDDVPDYVRSICCESCSNPACEDHDDIVATWGAEGFEKCSDIAMYGYCEEWNVETICCESCSEPEPEPEPEPAPTPAPCADDDDKIVALASNAGIRIGGCDDVKSFCEHGTYGTTVQATCPVTCDSCTRRLADGKRIDELTGMASLMPAPVAGIRQKTDEFSNPDTSLFYP